MLHFACVCFGFVSFVANLERSVVLPVSIQLKATQQTNERVIALLFYLYSVNVSFSLAQIRLGNIVLIITHTYECDNGLGKSNTHCNDCDNSNND